MKSRTLSELAKLTGLKPRTLQFWTTSGVIVPEDGTKHGGPGIHRRYSHNETIISCIITEVSKLNVQIGTLVSISSLIRDAINWHEFYTLAVESAGDEQFSYQNLEESYKSSKYKQNKNKYPIHVVGYDHDKRPFNSYLERIWTAISEGISGMDGTKLALSFDGGTISITALLNDDFHNPTNTDLPSAYLVVNLGKILPKAAS